jgi:hypothetical protein
LQRKLLTTAASVTIKPAVAAAVRAGVVIELAFNPLLLLLLLLSSSEWPLG